jgi:serine/threonine protein kinase
MSSVESLSSAGGCQLAERLGFNGAVATYKGVLTANLQNVCVVAFDKSQLGNLPAVPRFREEFDILLKSNPPGLARAIAYGEEPGYYWSAFEYLKGVHLGIHVRDKGLPTIPDALSVIASTVGSLIGLHELGYPHRVITPASIFIREPGEVRLMHAGWAGLLLGAKGGPAHPCFMSNLPFLAPEIARGDEGNLSSDVYSIGANLYFLLTGQPLFWSDDPETLAATIGSTPVDLSAMHESVPGEVADLLDDLLAFETEDRPLNLEALKERLDLIGEQLLRGPVAPGFQATTPNEQSTPRTSPSAEPDGEVGRGDSAPVEQAVPEPDTDPHTARLLELAQNARKESERLSSGFGVPKQSVASPSGSVRTPGVPPDDYVPPKAFQQPLPPAPLPVYVPPPAPPTPAESAGGGFSIKTLVLVGILLLLVVGAAGWGAAVLLSSMGTGGRNASPAGATTPAAGNGTTQPTRTPRPSTTARELESYNQSIERMKVMAHAQRAYAQKYGVWVASPDALEELAVTPESTVDAWETPLEYRIRFTVSAGPDKRWDTPDDVWINSETLEVGGWAPSK